MSLLNSLKTRLESASRFAQIALASECGDRVYTIYKEYWMGTFDECVLQSIELGKNYSYGEKIDENHLQRCLAEVQDIVEFYREEGITVLATTVTVVLRILQSIVGNDEDTCVAVARCLISCLDTAQAAETMANQASPKSNRVKVAVNEEQGWQDAALEKIDGWPGVAYKGMFDSVGEKSPIWIKDWLSRSVR